MALYPPTFQSHIGYRAFIYFTENKVHYQIYILVPYPLVERQVIFSLFSIAYPIGQ